MLFKCLSERGEYFFNEKFKDVSFIADNDDIYTIDNSFDVVL